MWQVGEDGEVISGTEYGVVRWRKEAGLGKQEQVISP
jgi:hypothetical protein